MDGSGWPDVAGLEASVVSPSGDAVAFRRADGPAAGLYRYDVAGDETTCLGTEVAIGPSVDHLAWTPDGEAVLYHRAGGIDGPDIWAVDRDGEVRPVVDGAGAFLLTDVAEQGMLYLDREGYDLYRADDSGTDPVRADGASVFGAKFGPDGRRVAYTAVEPERDGPTVFVTGPVGDGHDAFSAEVPLGVRAWTTAGLLVEVSSMAATSRNIGWFEVPAEAEESGTEPPLATVGSETCIEHPLDWLPDGRILAERRTREAGLVPVLYDRGGSCTVVPVAPGVADFAGEGYGASLSDGTLAVEGETPSRPRTAFRFDPDGGDVSVLLDPAAESGKPDGSVEVETTHCAIESVDGTRVGVLRSVPAAGTPPRPAVIRVPDRPRIQAWRGFRAADRRLLAGGIEVVRVNQRGAAAYLGEDAGLDGAFGRDDQADVVAAARWLADLDAVDSDRIAVAGRYYGGYTALLQLCRHPSQYACGVAWDPLTDLRTYCEDRRAAPQVVGAIEGWLDECDPDEWHERSPIAHADGLRVPLALVHRIDDDTVPHAQADAFRRALSGRGVDVDHRRVREDDAGERFAITFLLGRLEG